MRHGSLRLTPRSCVPYAPLSPPLFGFPWILSSEMGLFNGLRARWGDFYFFTRPFPPHASPTPFSRRTRRPTRCARQTSRRLQTAGWRRELRQATSRGPIGATGSQYGDLRFLARNCTWLPIFLIRHAMPGAKTRRTRRNLSGRSPASDSGAMLSRTLAALGGPSNRSGRQQWQWLPRIGSW